MICVWSWVEYLVLCSLWGIYGLRISSLASQLGWFAKELASLALLDVKTSSAEGILWRSRRVRFVVYHEACVTLLSVFFLEHVYAPELSIRCKCSPDWDGVMPYRGY